MSIFIPHKHPRNINNAALICDTADTHFLEAALSCLSNKHPTLLVSDNKLPVTNISPYLQISFTNAGLETVPLNLEAIRRTLRDELQKTGESTRLIVDMAWGLSSVSAFANFDLWGMLCDLLNSETGHSIVSIYNRDILIEDQLLAAMRGHREFLSPAGIHENPYWLPPHLLQRTSLMQQIDFQLGRIMPDYRYQSAAGAENQDAASGANPEWIRPPRRIRPLRGADVRWKIRCFGQLRIYTSNSQLIDWQIPGSAPKKTRALFAYLLQRGEKGASAERMAEFLWPQEDNEETKRSRLHHCITMLRKTLGHKGYLQRHDNYYQLIPPPGSWIDVANFEQLCRQSKVMTSEGHNEDALNVLRAAERLYTGDLFEDLLPEYVESEMEDWCLPQRQWFREMAMKVHRDLAELLRLNGQFKDAMASCRKALAMDPSCEMAHAEAMLILHSQSRFDAVERQYRQYLKALSLLGVNEASPKMHRLFTQMIPNNNSNAS